MNADHLIVPQYLPINYFIHVKLGVTVLQWDYETWPECHSWTYWKWKIFVSIAPIPKEKKPFKNGVDFLKIYLILFCFVFQRFLDILAARKDPCGLSGEVLIDGAPQPPNFKCLSGYVVQVHTS